MMQSASSITADGEPGVDAMSWRYIALDRSRGGDPRHGQMVAPTAADVRASLRRIGLQPIDVQPVRRARSTRLRIGMLAGISADVTGWWHRRSRARRSSSRAELYDALATMLESGLPLLEALQTSIDSRSEDSGSGRRAHRESDTLLRMRERLRGGDSLAQAMRDHPGWFDAIDIAMIEAGQHSGTLPNVLTSLSQRQERSSELAHRVWGALAYPLLVMLVGLGVVVFLSVKTLPDLTRILTDAGIPIPALTARVMWFGQTLAGHWLVVIVVLVAAAMAGMLVPKMLARMSIEWPMSMRRIASRVQPPRFMRQLMVGRLVGTGGLADLLRSGVPMVDALRVLAPTQRSPRLGVLLTDAAQRLERGDDLSTALSGGSTDLNRNGTVWFDAELRRLVEIGQASGELDVMLERIGERYQRRAKRLIDRMTAVLEPAVLLLLAAMVGTVVMAAILPLLALQEILS